MAFPLRKSYWRRASQPSIVHFVAFCPLLIEWEKPLDQREPWEHVDEITVEARLCPRCVLHKLQHEALVSPPAEHEWAQPRR